MSEGYESEKSLPKGGVIANLDEKSSDEKEDTTIVICDTEPGENVVEEKIETRVMTVRLD